MREFGGKGSRANGSAGCGSGYVLASVESRRKAAIVARAVMLGGGGVVVQVEGFGVEDVVNTEVISPVVVSPLPFAGHSEAYSKEECAQRVGRWLV